MQNPAILGTIRINDRDEIRVERSRYRERDYLSLRIWRTRRDGELVPTRRAVYLRIDELPKLEQMLSEAKALSDGVAA